MPARGWLDVLKRSWREMGQDNLSLIAAGVAFYAFTAMVPLLGAVVLTYGLIADPAAVMRHFQELSQLLPGEAARLIGEQLMNVVNTAGSKKGLGLILALALAFWGATKATGAIVTALNIAYEEEETRGFVKQTLINLAMVLGAVLVLGVAMIAISVFSYLGRFFPGAPAGLLLLGKLISWLMLAAIGAAAVATLYRYAPDRDAAKWRWLTPGSAFAAIGWGVLTAGFGLYVANFGNYNATYGSLGAVVVLLTWLYLSALVLLLGAELNSELEHQTARDTTRGAERPLGQRGAQMADRVAPDEDGHAHDESPIGTPAPAARREETTSTLPYGLKVSEALLILLLALIPSRRSAQPAE
ncbi:YihY/virulence factor BrkB family protein [Sphingomonas sp. ID1715]|uniref:YihY/virulence factor BrkB family protein n=1 Tax=Sphingomonas sp. ID1715 TaxID=1656898 RepID=UPI0020C4D043|nr:YihY/virulence factor BrkB family protein [Sphingomonas sp. ID1715]